jgi:ATP-dependent DNA helicase RecG
VGSALATEIPRLTKEQVFERLQVLEGPPEHRRVRNIGLLMFCNEPKKFIPYAQIDVVWFPNGAGADEFEEQIFTGTLPQQLRGALEYIFGKVKSERVVKYPDRPEAGRFWSYPDVAIEEALANAVYHRNYELREPIEVRIFPSEILIHSMNGVDARISMESLHLGKAVVRSYRNRRIGEFLKELKFTEGRNTGIAKMLDALKKNGSPPPVFHSDDARTYFVTELKIHPVFLETEPAPASPEHDFASIAEVAAHDKAHDKAHDISNIELKILDFCSSQERSVPEILAHVEAHVRSGHIKRVLAQLTNAGLLALTIPDKPKSKNQKRITTTQGKAVVDNLTTSRRSGHGKGARR